MSRRKPNANGTGGGNGHAEDPARIMEDLSPEARRWIELHPVTPDPEPPANRISTVEYTTVIGNPKVSRKGERPVGRAVFRRLADVASEEYDWFWPGRIPVGEPVLFYGDCDQGKSMLSVALAATVTAGGRWPDLPLWPVKGGSVVFIQDEDTLATTLRPRVEAAGGDPARVHSLEHVAYPDGLEVDFQLRAHVAELAAGLESMPDCRLLVIDPVSAYLGGVDDNNNSEVRAALRPLARLARRRGIAVVMITHLTKGAGVKANYRVMGSGAFTNAPRAAYLVATDPDDRERRLVAPSKFNLGVKPAGLAYRFKGKAIEWEADAIPGLTADSLMARERAALVRAEGDGRRGPVSRRIKDVVLFILERVDAGPVPLTELRRSAEASGYPTSTFFHAVNRLRDSGQVEDVELDGVRSIRKGATLFPKS